MKAPVTKSATDGHSYQGVTVPDKAPKLSSRELEVLRGVLANKTYPQIATDLGLGLETIKSYSARLRAKLGVPNKTGLALWAERNLKG